MATERTVYQPVAVSEVKKSVITEKTAIEKDPHIMAEDVKEICERQLKHMADYPNEYAIQSIVHNTYKTK